MATLAIEGLPGWVVRELTVPEWTALESIRLDESLASGVRESSWLSTLMMYSVESESGEPRWASTDAIKIVDVVRHGDAIAHAALKLNGLDDEADAGNASAGPRSVSRIA